MKLTLNKDHVAKWQRLAVAWLVFVLIGLIAGWHLKPRMDEFVFVLTLPLWAVLAPYAAWCLLAALLKSFLPIRLQTSWRRYLGLKSNHSLRDEASRPDNRLSD